MPVKTFNLYMTSLLPTQADDESKTGLLGIKKDSVNLPQGVVYLFSFGFDLRILNSSGDDINWRQRSDISVWSYLAVNSGLNEIDLQKGGNFSSSTVYFTNIMIQQGRINYFNEPILLQPPASYPNLFEWNLRIMNTSGSNITASNGTVYFTLGN